MKSRFALVLIFASLTFVSCKPKHPKSAEGDSKPLVFARPGDSVGLDMASQDEGEALTIGVNIFETLVEFKSGTAELEPKLAEKWDISPDGKTYTFYLRKNVKFQDGTPMNADAVLFSFERQWKKDHPAYKSGVPYKYWGYLSMDNLLADIKKVDDFTVKIILKKPNAPFLANIAMPFLSIVSPTAVLKFQKQFDQNPVGTGPYRLKSWKRDDSMELEAFENYWGDKPHIKRVIVRVIPDNQVRLLELKRGSIQIMDYPNPSDLDGLKGDKNISMLTREGLNVGYLAFNMKKPPLDRLEVRQAISYAIDRNRILKEIFLNYGALAKNAIPPELLGYDSTVPEVQYNPEKAKALLKKTGLQNIKIDLWAMPVTRPYNPNPRKMAEFIQSDLSKVGIETKIVSFDWGTYLDKAGKGEHEMGLFGWQGDNGDPDNFLYSFYSKDTAMVVPAQNFSFYINDEVTKWLKDAQIVSDTKKRADLYHKVLQKVAVDLPLLPIAHSLLVVLVRNEVEGFVPEPIGASRRFASVRFK
ncbi:MAG: peptide/nickel transport system substrate-binding protein [Bacteriovoracaceae bacterium]|nr:peptide/nickel transport system substrate-binding protein [Bacteriovoracaceae bacterium]